GRERRGRPGGTFQEAISDAAATAAFVLGARAIVAFTESGFSARLISQARPGVPIIALTPFVEVQRRLALSWGVVSRLIRKVKTTDEMVEEVEASLLDDVRFEAALLAQDPVVVEGTMRSDWAALGQGVWPWIVTLTQDRLADLLLIVDGSGAPLVQVPPAQSAEVPAVARPDATVARLDVVD